MNKQEKLSLWIRDLQRIADELELDAEEANAEHIDFIVSDLRASLLMIKDDGDLIFFNKKFNNLN